MVIADLLRKRRNRATSGWQPQYNNEYSLIIAETRPLYRVLAAVGRLK